MKNYEAYIKLEFRVPVISDKPLTRQEIIDLIMEDIDILQCEVVKCEKDFAFIFEGDNLIQD